MSCSPSGLWNFSCFAFPNPSQFPLTAAYQREDQAIALQWTVLQIEIHEAADSNAAVKLRKSSSNEYTSSWLENTLFLPAVLCPYFIFFVSLYSYLCLPLLYLHSSYYQYSSDSSSSSPSACGAAVVLADLSAAVGVLLLLLFCGYLFHVFHFLSFAVELWHQGASGFLAGWPQNLATRKVFAGNNQFTNPATTGSNVEDI